MMLYKKKKKIPDKREKRVVISRSTLLNLERRMVNNHRSQKQTGLSP